jgi:hypothetical protein
MSSPLSSSPPSSPNVETSVATALSDGLERLVEMSGVGGAGLGRESLPILESFLHATDILVESAGTLPNPPPPLLTKLE